MRKHLVLSSTLPVICLLVTSCGLTSDIARRRYFDEGRRHYEHGQYREAAVAFRKAVQKDSEFGEAYRYWALAELKPGGDGTRALAALRRAMVLLSGDEEIKV